jgi:hypothetical protein
MRNLSLHEHSRYRRYETPVSPCTDTASCNIKQHFIPKGRLELVSNVNLQFKLNFEPDLQDFTPTRVN